MIEIPKVLVITEIEPEPSEQLKRFLSSIYDGGRLGKRVCSTPIQIKLPELKQRLENLPESSPKKT